MPKTTSKTKDCILFSRWTLDIAVKNYGDHQIQLYQQYTKTSNKAKLRTFLDADEFNCLYTYT